MFDFFLEETVLWDKSNHLFFTYAKAEENNPMIPVGMIDGENFSGLCDIILQRAVLSAEIMMWTRLKSKINEPWKYSTKFAAADRQLPGNPVTTKIWNFPIWSLQWPFKATRSTL